MTDDAQRKIPALVISGFLGSGKTTLVRHLLEAAREQELRIAFVSNELGALGIDRALLGQGEAAFVELEGGCVCCELSDDLVDTLQMLRENVNPDRIVIETSGVALPFDTTLNFWREPIVSWVGDDVAIVVVDAEQVAEDRDLEGTFADQVSSADILVVNKIDLVDDDALAGIERRLRTIEPDAPILYCVNGAIPPDVLFPPELTTNERAGPPPIAPPHRHEQFTTREWRPAKGIATEALERELDRPDLLRAKGWAETAEGTKLVQVVGHRIELTDDEPPDPELVGRIVMIERS